MYREPVYARKCRHCRKVLVRREGEGPARFRKRKYCDHACSVAAQVGRAQSHNDGPVIQNAISHSERVANRGYGNYVSVMSAATGFGSSRRAKEMSCRGAADMGVDVL